MASVLAVPVTYNLTNRRYGKGFNILNNLFNDRFSVDAYVSRMEDRPRPKNVCVHETGSANKLTYYVSAFQAAKERLDAGSVDIYHHMNLSYRWFNPLLLTGVHGDTPVIIGPCQAGHEIMKHEFNHLVTHAVGWEVPKRITDAMYRVIDSVRGFLDPSRMWLFKETLDRADRIVVVHEEAKAEYAQFVDESKLIVIPLGVDPGTFSYSDRSDTMDIVAIGSLKRRKAYDDLLDAVADITGEFSGAHLHVFGEGPLEDDLKRRARRLGIEESVTFHGFVDQSVVRDHLQRARAFVHPSLSESFSLVRLEAMATGCPVIVSDISGATEMVRDGEEGFVVPKRSPDRIAGALRALLSNQSLASRMGKAARDRVEDRYDWRTIGKQYLSVYRSLL